ncbi:DEAD/DEAH box helicase [Paenibacillus gansuensis]|uniref:DEAD/DEAH box helicase n=1 Tax=Paenibacillus gansuensis TaxID=306542 RepID=A0ABW5PJX2_9BACL
MGRLLRGRSLLPEEALQLWASRGLSVEGRWRGLAQLAYLLGELEFGGGVSVVERRRGWLPAQRVLACSRCGSGGAQLYGAPCAACGSGCVYCEACLTMGRAKLCTPLLQGAGHRARAAVPGGFAGAAGEARLGRWGLSPAQTEASAAGVRFLARRGSGKEAFLIWAVTGAGKTEMIFPLIDHALAAGGKVCVATPRRDVVLELQPRLAKAFTDRKVVTLYGGSEERWEEGDVVLATTHQLLRFHEAFDVVIVDELDAFPFHNNPMLEYAARRVCKVEGKFIFLSATPPPHLQQLVRRGRLPHVKVPVRYHRHPLPVPKRIVARPLRALLSKQRLPARLTAALEQSLSRGAQLFVFVPKIRHIDGTLALLRGQFSGFVAEGTSSKDSERAVKVQRFRSGDIRILVTTTILERGVTVPKTDVFILDADSELFDEAALVQMSGRAGRSKDDPAGRVYYAASDMNAAQSGAIRQIRSMNRIAARKGYLLEGSHV